MSITLKKSSQTLLVKWSASHMLNNLTMNRLNESRRSNTYGVSHKSGFAMVTVSEDGTKQIQGQVICRATGTGGALGADYDARFLSYVVQASFVNLPVRTLLVLACTKSIQIYDCDGTTSLYIHTLEQPKGNRSESSVYFRGITGIGQNLLCIGNHLGEILIFTIPPKGNNITLKESKTSHQFGITNLVSNAHLLISSDTSGLMLIWNIRTMSQINMIESIDGSGVTSLGLWNNCIIASFANGMIRVFDPENAQMCGSIAAHARSINAIDCNDLGILATVGDDCFVRLWKLSGCADDFHISHMCNYQLQNQQLVGVKFVHLSRADLIVSAYDTNELTFLRAV